MPAVTSEGLKIAKLIKVESGANNNKFYHMFEQKDGTFKAIYGRVGAAKPAEEIYPMSKWETKYKEKLSARKGYKDQTDLFVLEDTASSNSSSDPIAISDSAIKKFIEQLMDYANESIQRNYTVSADKVSQKQVDEAQNLINEISALIKKLRPGNTADHINEKLVQLYSVIPRKMAKVKEHLFDINTPVDEEDIPWAKTLIQEEQDTLDVMAGQVYKPETAAKEVKKPTGLEQFGIEVEKATDDDIAQIKKLLGSNASQFRNAYRVKNVKTQLKFDKELANAKHKKTKLLWHGSRNQNWWNILKMGLVLRPNAIISGKMFGEGSYFADKAQKSIGYTSLDGSYWAKGGEKRAYLALYEVHLGNWWHVKKHDYSMTSLDYKKLRAKGEYDSLFAEGGYDLRNNEYIVYQESQNTVKFVVEIGR